MKVFLCDHCRNLVFFENVTCLRCGKALAYLPPLGVVGSLEPDADGIYRSPLPRAAEQVYRLCVNYSRENVCSWAVPADENNPYCRSCRLTTKIPDLSIEGNREAWGKLEAAKRRLIYTLDVLGLPLEGLSFEFLADLPGAPVLTGHANGLITVNIAEADDAERERRKHAMNEPYRTLVGHMRHESAHFYFDLLITKQPAQVDGFRALFGDEREDYGEALKRHYARGPSDDWQQHHVSAYAASHPWEDWAETWAHYLHMADALETGACCGVAIYPTKPEAPASAYIADPLGERPVAFDKMLASWHALTYLLNNLNRGMGLPDGYPFVLSGPVVEKLRFVHVLLGDGMPRS